MVRAALARAEPAQPVVLSMLGLLLDNLAALKQLAELQQRQLGEFEKQVGAGQGEREGQGGCQRTEAGRSRCHAGAGCAGQGQERLSTGAAAPNLDASPRPPNVCWLAGDALPGLDRPLCEYKRAAGPGDKRQGE